MSCVGGCLCIRWFDVIVCVIVCMRVCVFTLELYPYYTAKLQVLTFSIKHPFLGINVSSFWVYCIVILTLITRVTIRSHNLGPKSFIILSFLHIPVKLWGSPDHPCFQKISYNFRDSLDPHRFYNFYKCLIQLRITLFLLQFYYKGYTEGEVWEGPGSRVSMPPSLWHRGTSPSQHISVLTKQENCTELQCLYLLRDFHFVGIID